MAAPRFDVLGIGNAIVDVIARTDDDFLVAQKMQKGGMALIDEARAKAIYDAMGPATQISGGSAANTIAGVASFGARAAFVGKVKDDEVGRIFRHDITKAGVTFETQGGERRPGDRALLHHGDAGRRAHDEYVSRRRAESASGRYRRRPTIADAAITYLEGYLWDPKDAKEAFLKAAKIAHGANRMVALTLSDAFCVDRYRAEFLKLLRDGVVDLLFANEAELKSLYETADFDTAVAALRKDAKLAAVTRSEKGCVVVSRDKVEAVPAAPIAKLVDTTGAGDLFAAGFLIGIARGRDHVTAGKLGALAAAEVIQHLGARPETSLKALAADSGLAV